MWRIRSCDSERNVLYASADPSPRPACWAGETGGTDSGGLARGQSRPSISVTQGAHGAQDALCGCEECKLNRSLGGAI